MEWKISNACCFIGHREIIETEELRARLYSTIEKLILEENIDTFLFGSKSRFNSLCYEQISKLKEKYPHLKRIYIRAEFPEINDSYKSYLSERYEYTCFPKNLLLAGKAIYIERNQEMINKSSFCLMYYSNDYSPQKRKSGTKSAYNYACVKNKKIIIFP